MDAVSISSKESFLFGNIESILLTQIMLQYKPS